MLQWLVIAFASIVLIVTFVLFLTKKGWGFFRPQNNIEAVVLRGKILDHTICGDTDYYWDVDANGKSIPTKRKARSIWYKLFGIRYFGIPGIYKIASVIVNYPPQLQSTSRLPHKPNDVTEGFDIRHNYLVVLEGVEFKGGISFNLEFSVDVKLKRPDVAWNRGRSGRFLDPLGQCIEGVVKQLALSIDATDFVGKTQEAISSPEKKTEIETLAKQLRARMCEAITELNSETNQGGGSTAVGLAELCGYEIIATSYKDLEPGNENSKLRLNLLETRTEAALRVDVAKQNAKINAAEGKGAASKILAIGTAEAKVSKLKKDAVGAEVMIAEINAEAIRNTQVTTLVIGGQGSPSLILPLPSTNSKPGKVESKPEQSPEPPAE